jgi:hypothetical protein
VVSKNHDRALNHHKSTTTNPPRKNHALTPSFFAETPAKTRKAATKKIIPHKPAQSTQAPADTLRTLPPDTP